LIPLIDTSNLDTNFFRNRLRHELIPHLDEYVPGVQERLWQMAAVLAGDHNILEAVVTKAWQACLLEMGAGYVALDFSGLRAQPLGVQRRLVRKAVGLLRPDLRELDYAATERALDILENPAQIRDLALGVNAFCEGDRFYIAGWEADLPRAQWPQLSADEMVFPIPGKLNLPGGWQIQVDRVDDFEIIQHKVLENSHPYRVWADLGDQESTHMHVRSRRPGDRFCPLGMGEHSLKLSDFMINEKIPQRARARWPLLCLGDEIVWVPGYRLAHPYRLTQTTNHAWCLQLTRVGDQAAN
jgi:tRNA(Ile)-lysidine synthase